MTNMVRVEEAIDRLGTLAPAAPAEPCPLAEGLGRILHTDLIAQTTLPPSDASAMDGYAVRFEDTAIGGAMLKVIGEAPAGQPFPHTIGKGEAVRIFTGSAMPPGADHVLVQEQAEPDGQYVRVIKAQKNRRHIRRTGLDFHEGQILLKAGTVLGPAQLAVAAAANHGRLTVRKRPRVAVMTSGDELCTPGSVLGPGAIADSNSTALGTLLKRWGAQVDLLGIAPDSIDAIHTRLSQARDADIIVAIGGASVGEHDHMRAAFIRAGAHMLFGKVAVKPGKPTWCARLGSQTVLGLPGNPASAYVCAHLFLAPLLAAANPAPPRRFEARLDGKLPANGSRDTYLRAVADSACGKVSALAMQDTALLTPFLEANCLIHRTPGSSPAAQGTLVNCLRLVTEP